VSVNIPIAFPKRNLPLQLFLLFNSDSLTSGSIVATPMSAVISDKLGRRKCMFVGAWIIIIGSVIIASGMTLAQFVVGRFILGVGIQVMVVSAPAYAVEIAPPHWRGRAVG
jgi:MFS family permease